MDVSVIIVNYKTIGLIINCIKSIIKKTEGIEYEIIVVDNNSDDNFSEILKTEFGPKVKCLALEKNLGFGLANNEGAKIAVGRNLFFLNPDTILLNNAIKLLSNYLDENPHVGGCGGNLYDEELKPTISYERFYPSILTEFNEFFFGRIYRYFIKNPIYNNTTEPISVAYISGADLMIPKTLFDEIDGFSSDFFMYYEETELCFRIKRRNYDVISNPRARIQHLQGRSFSEEDVKEWKYKIMNESRLTFYRKCYPKWYCNIVNYIYVLGLYFRLFCLSIIPMKRNRVIKKVLSVKKKIFVDK